MKKTFLFFIAAASMLSAMAQTTVDHFNVGPYDVDYRGKGDIKYRLDSSIDLYEFYGLKKDTVFVNRTVNVFTETVNPIAKGMEIGAKVAFGTRSVDFAITGRYMVSIANAVYFTPGLSVDIVSNIKAPNEWSTLEVGVPLTIGYSEINHVRTTLYGEVGVKAAYYSAIKSPDRYTGDKSGMLIAPVGEIGLNIPSNNIIWRVGLYAEWKRCLAKDGSNIYGNIKNGLGNGFIGAKFAVVL